MDLTPKVEHLNLSGTLDHSASGAKCEDSVVISKAEGRRSTYARLNDYELHYRDALDGSTVRVRQFEAENDEAAIAYSEEVRSLTTMELWQGDRRVRQWESFPPRAIDD